MCISWTNKGFEIINARYNNEDYFSSLLTLQMVEGFF
jgi:hypothetical protein